MRLRGDPREDAALLSSARQLRDSIPSNGAIHDGLAQVKGADSVGLYGRGSATVFAESPGVGCS